MDALHLEYPFAAGMLRGLLRQEDSIVLIIVAIQDKETGLVIMALYRRPATSILLRATRS